MKRLLGAISLIVTGFILSAVGYFLKHPALMFIAILFGSMVALALIVWGTRWLAKFVGKSIISLLYILSAIVIVGILSWKHIINTPIGYCFGIVLGGLLIIVLFRKIASKAQKSVFIGDIFAFVSGYKIHSYIEDNYLIDKSKRITENIDFRNLQAVLNSLGYTNKESKDGSLYAIKVCNLDASMEEKIKSALSYLTNPNRIYSNSKN